MKKEFEFKPITHSKIVSNDTAKLCIIGQEPNNKPYIDLNLSERVLYLDDKEMKYLGLNILKSLGYKIKLKDLKGE